MAGNDAAPPANPAQPFNLSTGGGGPCSVEESKSRGLLGRPISDLQANSVGKANINACSRPRPFHKPGELRNVGQYKVPITSQDPICVDGKPYTDTDQIPGYQPTGVTDSSGKAVSGSDGAPMIGPSKGVSQMGEIANTMDGDLGTPVKRIGDMNKFYPAGQWDFQRVRDDDGSIVFIRKYTPFTNMLIGYADAKNSEAGLMSSEYITDKGAQLEDAGLAIKSFGRHTNVYGDNAVMDKQYPHILPSNVKNIRIGRRLRMAEPTQPYAPNDPAVLQKLSPPVQPPGSSNNPF